MVIHQLYLLDSDILKYSKILKYSTLVLFRRMSSVQEKKPVNDDHSSTFPSTVFVLNLPPRKFCVWVRVPQPQNHKVPLSCRYCVTGGLRQLKFKEILQTRRVTPVPGPTDPNKY